MMRQTAAIFLDAYRELNSKRMFWIVLVLSAVAMGGFAILGVRGRNLVFLVWDFPDWPVDGAVLYKYIYLFAMVGIWLTFGATILALISTASSFPDFVAGGSVDLFLAKPISRLRLFLTKYVAGFTFAFFQILIFAVASYFVLGLRGGIWRPEVLWAIPIELCFFSYLYSFCVLFGVWTRSTVASILLTVLVWFFLWGVQQAEVGLYQWDLFVGVDIATQEHIVQQGDQMLASLTRPSENTGQVMTSPVMIDNQKQQRDAAAAEFERQSGIRRWIRFAHTQTYRLMTLLPKTTATNNLLDRYVMTDADVRALLTAEPAPQGHRHGNHHQQRVDVEVKTQESLRIRSPIWIIGTSLAFEFVVVSLAAWIFCRRDY